MDMATGFTKCSLRACLEKGEIGEDEGRVEVKSFVDPALSAAHLVDWGESGEAVFHTACWSALCGKAHDRETPLQGRLDALEARMVQEAARTAERHDSEAAVSAAAARVAALLQGAQRAIVFTGAGISTAAGIGDFRGKAGKWTEDGRRKEYGAAAKRSAQRHFSYTDLRPTYTHEAIVKLMELGLIKHVISQNCDGLHALSGVAPERLWELHGNVFHERCEQCPARYERSFPVGWHRDSGVPARRCQNCGHNHRTSRVCQQPGCGGYLQDTTINFSDNLEPQVLAGAEQAARENDLVLALGTTLRVSPANSLVELGTPLRLVVCNRQPTPCDGLCARTVKLPEGQKAVGGVRVFGDCDRLMRKVMAHLLSKEDLSAWQKNRAERMRGYGQRRGPPVGNM